MEESIAKALKASPDYSENFTEAVAGVRGKLEKAIGQSVYHDPDMNYSASQSLSVSLDTHGQPVQRGDASARHELVFFVSSRGKLHTAVWRTRISHKEWRLCTPDVSPSLQSRLHRLIEEGGYALVQGPVLDELVPGAVTDMDAAPATVFEVLFSELR
jgi:hypothetical protein